MKQLIFTLLIITGTIPGTAQNKYYSAVSDTKAVKDIVIAFKDGLQIDNLGGTALNGTVTYNTGKNDKVEISLTKIETAVDDKGRTGERKYYTEMIERGGTYTITEWPQGTFIVYTNAAGKKFTFHCQDDYNFDRQKPFDWYRE